MTGTIKTDKLRGMHRLCYIEKEVMQVIEAARPTLIVYEGYAMGIKGGGRVFDLGELGGVLKKRIWEEGISLMVVPPATLQLAVTGSGGVPKKANGKKGDKKAALASALDRFYGYTIDQNDEADALGLMLMGEVRSGKTTIDLRTHPMAVAYKCEVHRGRRV